MNYQRVAASSLDYPLGQIRLGDGFLPTIPKAYGFEAATLFKLILLDQIQLPRIFLISLIFL
jgi:hypothetical protein